MLKTLKALTASALMTLALSACASIETRGLPKCSGRDRRPLNADLWAWQGTQPKARPESGKTSMSMRYAPSAKPASPATEAVNNLASADRPRWAIAASEAACS